MGRARSSIDRATAAIYEDILEGTDDADTETQRLRTFYHACVTDADDGARSHQALRGWIARVEEEPSITTLFIDLQRIGVHAFLRFSGVPDPSDATAHRGQLQQARLVVAKADPKIRPALVENVRRLFVQSGMDESEASRRAGPVGELEMRLVSHALPFESDEFPSPETEHSLTAAALTDRVPSLELSRFFDAVGVSQGASLNVKSPAYLDALEEVLSGAPESVLRDYLRWKLMLSLGPDLPSSGEPRPRDTRAEACRLSVLRALGVELSRQFVLRSMDLAGREEALRIGTAVQSVAVEQLQETPWMSDVAREATVRKLAETDVKIGFPEQWPSTGSFPLFPNAHLNNVLAARAYEQERAWRRATAPRSRASWEMTVRPNEAWGMAAARLTIVNGYPDPFTNSIILPAASLQPPVFDRRVAPEVNYATFGVLVGHELIHVAQNYLFDAEGRAHTIWRHSDIDAQIRAQRCLVEHAAASGIDGTRTIEENDADLAGIRLAYRAMEADIGARIAALGRDGFTAQQRFFVAYGQAWCEKETEEHAADRLVSDYHAPPWFRVNGIVTKLPEFAEAFECRPVEETCETW